MKHFDYKGRDTSGKLVNGTCAAEDRTEALRHIRAQGIVPVEVSASLHAAKLSGMQLRLPKYALIAGGVLLIGTIVWLMSRHGKDESHPAAPSQQTERARSSVAAPAAKTPKRVKPVEPVAKDTGDTFSESPLTDSSMVAAPAPDSAPQRPRTEGSSAPTVFTVPRVTNDTARVFDRSIETYMSQYAIPGRPMPPPPPGAVTNLEEQVREALSQKITVAEDEAEQTYQIKAAVAAMKEELREKLKSGGSAYDYFQQLHERQMSEADLCREARDAVIGLVQEGNAAEAKKSLSELNAYMESKGLPQVTVPPPYRKALGIQPENKAQ